ncbi:MAG: hypothetical protein LH629_13490 [Ignavibacteria bacterium]|nr:hypothetical protein [Ignavibacteria bacterium]
MEYSEFNKKLYRVGSKNGMYNLYSLNKENYPDVLNLHKSDLKIVYKTNIWVEVRGCNALFMGCKDCIVYLDVRPSEDVDILNAKEVDRGVFHAQVDKDEVKKMWEERLPYNDFPFPDNLEKIVILDLNDL